MPIILDGTKGETFPSLTTAGRPASPNTGQTGYNTTIKALEAYNGSTWTMVGLNGPAFMAYANASQTVTLSTWTKAAINTEETNGDPNSCFDTTNNRFLPTVAGYYQINGNIRLTAATTITQLFVAIYKNGVEYTRGAQMATSFTAGAGIQMPISEVIYFNGTSDYVELWGQIQGSGTAQFIFVSSSVTARFSGALLRSA